MRIWIVNGVAVLGLALVLGGCDALSSESGSPGLVLHVLDAEARRAEAVSAAKTFRLPEEEYAAVRLHNQSADPVYVVQCGGTVVRIVEQRFGAVWEAYAGTVCPGLYSSSLVEITPGNSRVTSLWIREPGTFRMRVDYWRGTPQADQKTAYTSPIEFPRRDAP